MSCHGAFLFGEPEYEGNVKVWKTLATLISYIGKNRCDLLNPLA